MILKESITGSYLFDRGTIMDVPNDPKCRNRVVIERVTPEVDGGRFPIKRVVGENVVVEADIFADGHEKLAARLLWRRTGDSEWNESPMSDLGNDLWQGEFRVESTGKFEYSIEGWIDPFATWRADLEKRISAGQDLDIELRIGADLLKNSLNRASGDDRARLERFIELVEFGAVPSRAEAALDEHLASLMDRIPDRRHATRYRLTLPVYVDRQKARFSSWYEMFPRSAAAAKGIHGNFNDVIDRLPYIAELGFDILYLPPVHPIGMSFRKGKNNALVAQPDDCGSPWGIGSEEGGHKAIHRQLGTLEDFHRLIEEAKALGMEVALDIALQCSPDHPYVKEHRQWFKERPDGTIQYAENPPKKYQDIYPLNFECDDWQNLWLEVKSIFDYWIQQGVTIFRVDNPHTKPFRFWEWLISGIKSEHPDILFLSEAFTRPKSMQRLSKVGFTQSYTYFTWRNNKWELEQYFDEICRQSEREYFIPSLWTNTPDILHEYLQTGGRPAFITRLVLAATASGSFGIYGPAYELCLNIPREKGSEEYIDSEKYEIKHYDLDDPVSIRSVVSSVNQARRDNPALQTNWGIHFHKIDNPFIMFYSRQTEDRNNIVLVAVNLDPFNTQIGWVDLNIGDLGLAWNETFQVHDLLTDEKYIWRGARNYIELNPSKMPAHLFRLKRRTGEGGSEEYE